MTTPRHRLENVPIPRGPRSIGAKQLNALLGLPAPTAEQAAVIEAPLAPAVVIAGAGSGKTETMAARVVWLVANRLVAPEGVLGLTFTRKASAELGSRIRRRLAQWRLVLERDRPEDHDQLAVLLAGEPTVLTYAAYAGRLVAEHALRIGAEPDSRLISPAVAWQLADAVSRRYPDELPADIGAPSSIPRYVLGMSGEFADHLVDADAVHEYCAGIAAQFGSLPLGKGIRSERPGDAGKLLTSIEHRIALLPLVQAFEDAKAALSAVDFADQMRVAAALARVPQVQAAERERFPAVLLDEYQDTGHAQVETLAGLFGQGHPVTAVGDPLQSIYGWRGASAGNIARFASTFVRGDARPATTFALATSFRNDRLILAAANTVAAPLRTTGATVELRPSASAGTGELTVARLLTVESEARWVATQLRTAWDAIAPGDRTAAVLVRRRSQIPLLAEALHAEGLPVEIVGLGGLLTTPEVVDVVSTLRVLVRHDLGSALARLLTGARWRIGPRDLAALRDRARLLIPRPAENAAARTEAISLVEALDDLGPPQRYSPAGYARLAILSDELRRLRQRVAAPLPELVADVERTMGIDVEVASRADRAHIGRAHLDRFLDEAARFANEADEATLTAFLAYLDAAEEEENGLEAGEIVVEAERVQILTVHGAKGLEWDVVAVPGLVDKVFPAEPRDVDWTRTRHLLPVPLRGDRVDLPAFDLTGSPDRKEVRDRVTVHHDALVARHGVEERRLAYVAFTRARSSLIASGFVWDDTQKPRESSPFLTELATLRPPIEWAEPDLDAGNPLTAVERTSRWPLDPLGPYPGDRGPGRRAAVEHGAALVRAALAETGQLPFGRPALPGRAGEWGEDVDRLLAERERLGVRARIEVELPRQLSVSQLVELDRDPVELARSIRRPLPRPPAPWARRGTRFHTWLEQRWQAQTLLDLDQLPGAADETAEDRELDELRAAFERSVWAARTPAHVEVPFEMALDSATVIRGRMDAVFGTPDGGWFVVDWKTGRTPSGADADAAAVQLAAYRLAWARLCDIPDDKLHTVRAAFHYVRSGETVEPAALLDAAGLRALVAGSPQSETEPIRARE